MPNLKIIDNIINDYETEIKYIANARRPFADMSHNSNYQVAAEGQAYVDELDQLTKRLKENLAVLKRRRVDATIEPNRDEGSAEVMATVFSKSATAMSTEINQVVRKLKHPEIIKPLRIYLRE